MIETPVYLTSTMAVGRIYDGAVSVAIDSDPLVADEVVIPVVGECDDSWLSTAAPVQVEAADAAARSPRAAAGPVAEGAVGAGTGMVCFGWKGGIGTASRRVGGHVVGALVLANFGVATRPALRRRAGGPRAPGPGRGAAARGELHRGAGDGPPARRGASSSAWRRRAGLGLAPHRVGRAPRQRRDLPRLQRRRAAAARDGATAPGHPEDALNDVFTAAVEATEAAVLNCLWAAPDVTGRDGRSTPGLPHDRVLELLGRGG